MQLVTAAPPCRPPASPLWEVSNLTPFRDDRALKMLPGRRFVDTVVIKGTFTFDAAGGVSLAPTQPPVVQVDRPRDRQHALRSSLAAAGEVVAFKPSTDVIVTGTAQSPNGQPRKRWLTRVSVLDGHRPVVVSSAEVTGPRRWRPGTLSGWTLEEPCATTRVPIAYELAYGGPGHLDNPSGCGHHPRNKRGALAPLPAPQWIPAGHRMPSLDEVLPVVGYGPVARHWACRTRLLGTYDQGWRADARIAAATGKAIDYPADFDPRFFQCASPSLITPRYLRGDEQLCLEGLLQDAPRCIIPLPGVQLAARLSGARHELQALPLDTVQVDLDTRRLHLCWRLTLDVNRGVRTAAITESWAC